MSTGPQIVTRVYDLVVHLLPYVSQFPRSHRCSIGTRVEQLAGALLEETITACYTKDRLHQLRQLNIRLEHLRYWLRMCKDLKLISLQRYEVTSRQVNDIGVQLGGWIKQQQGKPA